MTDWRSKSRLGRIDRRVRRRFIEANADAVPFSALAEQCYPRAAKIEHWMRWSVYRALERHGVPAGKRGWWLPKPELRRLIRGE
jgi:hypothetical protein